MMKSAVADVDEIWGFIAHDSIDAAQNLVDEIERTVRKLADFPGIGRMRNELRNGLRSFPVGAYLIFYVERPAGIDVVHVIHGARRLRPFFR